MNNETDESLWQCISQALFRVHKTTDERLFTSRVMAQVRQLQPLDTAWRPFVRWSVPAFVVAMTSLLLALREPAWTVPLSTDALLFQSQTADDDLVSAALED